MTYREVVDEAIKDIKERIAHNDYHNNKITYVSCPLWENSDQINLWTYWHGSRLENIDKDHVDILLVGQDWGSPEKHPDVCERIKEI